ncbi:HET-domain-containing protein, partial [Colletotrichum eremochloae]
MVFYQHNRLDLERPAIRLLRLEKGRHSVIACEVFQVFLDDRGCGVAYEALSYTWGPPELTQEIRVNNKKLPVTENLHEALVRLRHPDRDRILWIDAICIDQTNAREQSHQVQQMGEIYHKADQVLFWLGPATDDTDSLLETFGWLEDEAGKHPCDDWHPSDVRWGDICRDVDDRLGQRPNLKDRRSRGLETLLGRGWFTRVWILQEVASAHAARICCGGKSVSTQYFGVLPGWLGVAPSPHCQAVIDMMPSVSRAHSWWADRRDIFTLLRHFGHSNATEPRDIIYAICGISTDASGPDVLTPDYTIPAQELTSKVSQFLF